VIDNADAFLRLEIKKGEPARAFNRTIVARDFRADLLGIATWGALETLCTVLVSALR
jgi:hypothetical protein